MSFALDLREKALRPSAFVVAAGLHVLALIGVALPRTMLATPTENIEITIEPQQGDATPDMNQQTSPDSIAQNQAAPDAKPDPAKLDETEPPPPPEAVEKPEQLAAEPPKRAVDDAPQIAQRLREQKLRQERLREKREEQREEREEERRHEAHLRKMAAQKAAAQAARQARAGVANGSRQAGVSRANYGSLFRAALRRHQIHAAGVGSVGVAFTVGGSGHVVSASVTNSSGQGALDAAALRMVRSSSAGPPPGGSYSASTTINFVPH
jgi:protein TonB